MHYFIYGTDVEKTHEGILIVAEDYSQAVEIAEQFRTSFGSFEEPKVHAIESFTKSGPLIFGFT